MDFPAIGFGIGQSRRRLPAFDPGQSTLRLRPMRICWKSSVELNCVPDGKRTLARPYWL